MLMKLLTGIVTNRYLQRIVVIILVSIFIIYGLKSILEEEITNK